MYIQKKSEALKRLRFYKENRIPFVLEASGRSCKIITSYAKTNFTDSKLPNNELYFIQMVKNHIVKNEIKAKNEFLQYQSVDFMQFNSKKKGIYKGNLKEIDLTSAYWSMMYRLGYIDDNLYLKGLQMEKLTRLVSIGALASKKVVYQYDGNEEGKAVKTGIKFNKELFDIWFSVVYATDLLIKEAISNTNSDYFFYWVDAIFTDSISAEKIKTYFDNHLIAYKDLDIKAIQINEHKIYVRNSKDKLKIYNKPTYKKNFKDFFIKYFIE
jgi:hypothetical protein